MWYRRAGVATIPKVLVKEDHEFARKELAAITNSIRKLTGKSFWVNPLHATDFAEQKPVQLSKAKQLGIKIPRTLISTSPEAVHEFVGGGKEVIYKSLNGHRWKEKRHTYGIYTAKVDKSDLPNDEILEAVPGIYQERVEKKYEVRAQFFGATYFAICIDSMKLDYGEFDWRLNQTKNVASPLELPSRIYDACISLMQELGIVAGAFDFIVSPAEEWIFLEVNCGGQFLFIEDWCEELPLLDAFCTFLLARDANFVYSKPQNPLYLEEIMKKHDFAAAFREEQELRYRGKADRR